MILDSNCKLILTKHAIARSEQFQIPVNKLYWLFWHSDEEPEPASAKKYQKDGNEETVFYRRSDDLVMTVNQIIDKYNGKKAYLMITLFEYKMSNEEETTQE